MSPIAQLFTGYLQKSSKAGQEVKWGYEVLSQDFVLWPPKGHSCVGGSYSQSGTGAASSVLQVLECHMVLGGSSSSAYTEAQSKRKRNDISVASTSTTKCPKTVPENKKLNLNYKEKLQEQNDYSLIVSVIILRGYIKLFLEEICIFYLWDICLKKYVFTSVFLSLPCFSFFNLR